MEIVTINSPFLLKALRWLKVIKAGDTKEFAQIAPFGDDSTPPVGYKGVASNTFTASVPVIIGYFNRNQSTSAGEKRIFSIKENGDLSTYVYCRKDGKMELGGDVNFAVKYNELKTAYNKLQKAHNDLVSAFNSHMHATAAPGSPSPPTPGSGIPAIADDSDITTCKNENILTV